MPNVEGQCNCGAVRYTANGEVQTIVNCHCNMCRSINGAAFSTYVVVKLAELSVDPNDDNLSRYRPTDNATKYFCASCGTPIFNTNEKYPGAAMLHFGTLTSYSSLTPSANIFCTSKLHWVDSIGGAKSFDEAPG
jgi:hypothetical protein